MLATKDPWTRDRALGMMGPMQFPRPVPARGSSFLDARGDGRALRVTWHLDADVVVLSLWRDNVCAGSFRLGRDDVPEFLELLQRGLDTAYAVSDATRPEIYETG